MGALPVALARARRLRPLGITAEELTTKLPDQADEPAAKPKRAKPEAAPAPKRAKRGRPKKGKDA